MKTEQKIIKKNKIRCCLNCENWKVLTQNRFFCNGRCEASWDSAITSKDFCCGKFELTKALSDFIKSENLFLT